MAITVTIPELVMDVRTAADLKAEENKGRYPDDLLAKYAMRAINAFWRIGTEGGPQTEIGYASASKTTANGTSTYALSSFTPAVSDLMHLVLVELTANGARRTLNSFEHAEHAMLADTSVAHDGVPLGFRLIGTSLELRPTPGGAYTLDITYVPTLTQIGSTITSYDSFAGLLTEWVIKFALKEIAFRQKWWDVHGAANADLVKTEGDIRVEFRKRNATGAPRMVDPNQYDRFGRRMR